MSRETKLNKTLIRETTTSLIIDSKHYPEQNANDLTIYLDDELENVSRLVRLKFQNTNLPIWIDISETIKMLLEFLKSVQ
jgi:hypothetical protein